MLGAQVKAQDDKLEAVIAGIKPMLDCIGFAPPEGSSRLPSDLPHRSIVDRCQTVWADFKEFTCSVAHGAVVHTLAMLRSHYPSVDLERVVTGYARGMDAAKIAKLEDKAKEPGKKLASDIDLFGEGGSGAP